jgi:hypothetical protein
MLPSRIETADKLAKRATTKANINTQLLIVTEVSRTYQNRSGGKVLHIIGTEA